MGNRRPCSGVTAGNGHLGTGLPDDTLWPDMGYKRRMADTDIQGRIEAEIVRALRVLAASPAALRLAGTRNAGGALSSALERLGAPVELLSIVGSMGDTLSDAEALEALESYNRGDALMKVDLDARELEADRAMEALPIRRPRK